MKFTVLGVSALLITQAFAQNGDDRTKGKQIDPIPADQIPPSPYLNIKDSLKTFEVAEGFKLDAIAHGEIVRMPVALDFDADGGAWVVEMRNYMLDLDGSDENEPNGQIRILEDSNGDGNLDKATVFLDDLILPRAIAVTSDGVLYCSEDKLFFIKRDGYKPVGEKQLIDAEYAAGGNAEHKANGLLRGLDNWYYNAKSNKRYRRVNGKWVKESTLFRGQWGIAQDSYGRLYSNNNSTLLQSDYFRPGLTLTYPKVKLSKSPTSYLGNRVNPIRVNPGVNRAYTGILDKKTGKLFKVTAASGMTIYRGQNFPKRYQGSSLISAPCVNTVSMLDLKRNSNQSATSSNPFKTKDLIASTDEWFRPVNLYTAPDGSVWMLDMHFGLIQHKTYMTTYLRKQYSSRGLDKPAEHSGRIYRISYAANPLGKVPQLSKASNEELIEFLGHANGTVRDKAQRLLVEKLEKTDAAENSKILAKALEVGLKSNNEYQMVHLLWTLEVTGVIPSQLLLRALASESNQLQTIALELSHFSDQPLDDILINYEPTQQTVYSYSYALGSHAFYKTVVRLEGIVKKFPKAKYLQDLFIVGSRNLKDSSRVKNLASSDKRLNGLLKQLQGSPKKKVKKSGEGLKGEHLLSFKRGEKVFTAAACAACHGLKGEGQDATGVPPLAPSDWVVGDKHILGKVILNGLMGPITVNGEKVKTNMAMPPYIQNPALKDDKALADLLNFIRNMGVNKGGYVSEVEAEEIRAAAKKRNLPWNAKDLKMKE